MLEREIKGLVLSDIHLGHPKNPTGSIVLNLKREVKQHRDVDIIIISGDIYHKILSLGSTDAILSIDFIIWLGNFCTENNIILRVLEGTPSHDYKQPLMFHTVFKDRFESLDFRYVSDIEVEILPKFNLSILYVPDEIRPSIDETMFSIKKLLNGSEVDVVVMHGHFEYQLPFKLPSSFKEEDFDFVKYNIFIGHIHTHNPRGKIVPPGSFDRLANNEEEPKGYIRFRINPNVGASYTFIENKHAKRFDTILIETTDIKEAISILLNKIRETDSEYLRIKYTDKTLDVKLLNDVAKKNGVELTLKRIDPNGKDNKNDIIEYTPTEQFSITRDNILDILETEMDIVDRTIYDEEIKNLI